MVYYMTAFVVYSFYSNTIVPRVSINLSAFIVYIKSKMYIYNSDFSDEWR